MARVRALLRRSQSRHDVLGYADLTLDVTTRTVTRYGQVISLTRPSVSAIRTQCPTLNGFSI